jgi:MFS family permease
VEAGKHSERTSATDGRLSAPISLGAMPTPPESRRARARGLLIDITPLRHDRDFRWLWSGQLVNNLGGQVTLIALRYQVFVMTGSPLAIGGLAAASLAGLLIFTLPGGVIADRYDRRRILLVTQVAAGLVSLTLGLLALSGSPPLGLLYLLAFLSAAIQCVDEPTRQSAIPRLVADERQPSAYVLNQSLRRLCSVVGPALGGFLIALVGLPAAYLFDAATFIVAFVAILAIAPIPRFADRGRPGLAGVLGGLSFVRRTRVLVGTFMIDFAANFFGLPVALFPVLALETFHGTATTLGLLTAAPALGAFIGTLTAGWVGGVHHQGRAVVAAVVAWGAAIAAFGLLVFSLPLALLCLTLAGAADVVSAVFRMTILQQVTPDELRGRVAALRGLFATGSPRLGDIEATAVANLTSAQFSAFSGGALSIVAALLIAWRLPQLRGYVSSTVNVAPVAATVPQPQPNS